MIIKKNFKLIFFYMFNFIMIIVFFSSCTIYRGFHEMNSEKVKMVSYINNDRSVKFIGMHHMGKKMYYDKVKDSVDQLKRSGYVVYYEKTKVLTDTLQQDTVNRKLKKMLGFIPGFDSYKKITEDNPVFKKYIVQPSYQTLGIDSLDINADISQLEMTLAYEKKFGEIILTKEDFNIPINQSVKRELPKKKVDDIIINYRNASLANTVSTSNDKKILIIYGLRHIKGFTKELKKINYNLSKTHN